MPQDFYAAPTQTHHQLHHHSLHHQLQLYKASPQTQSSPDSDVRAVGDRSESIEDGKSESSSWKGESGENGGDRKGLGALRDDGEESNRGMEVRLLPASNFWTFPTAMTINVRLGLASGLEVSNFFSHSS